MIENKKILAIIPARGGSKGVPRKNIRELAGKPLIAWTIEAAKQSVYIDRCIISSDDEEIIEIARQYECEVPFVRPAALAQDDTPGIEPILHALSELAGYDIVMLLQPTSPLRTTEDIDRCIETMIINEASVCVSVTEPDKSPFWMYTTTDDNQMRPLIPQENPAVRRQDLSAVYVLNGAVYVAETDWLIKTKSFLTDETTAYLMPKQRSFDIDTDEDFLLCEFMINRN
ncbi:acylneuraminate cytidylyltransferase family protein [Domibacillus indicus]|uniref:acylneuraminate cytidylyltransferase family protein n=1 Tax=Domibacillus indicus TaxID=1437523 RepID=UPI000617CBF2|nr:acylneuraminate cytidylyltransferase family protein [Domibacillus indicus]